MKRTAKQMRVILIKDIPNVGSAGEIKDVKPGFARNFLLIKNMAVLISDPRSQELLRQRQVKKEKQRTKKDQLSSQLADLSAKELIFAVKVNKKGLPFRAVSAKEIAEKLKIPAAWIKSKPLKAIGRHQILIQSPDSKNQITVVLESEK